MATRYTTDKLIKGLRIYPTGFYIYYRLNGKRREMKISSKDVIREIETIAGGQYKVEEVSKKDFEKKNKEDALLEESSLKFDIINSKVSHSTGFQLPNIFSLLNSLIR